MDGRAKRQLTILGASAAIVLILGLALGASWTLNLWDTRQQINNAEVASCENENSDCAKKDLPAQVRAATAAEAMADIAIWQTVLSGLGVGGLLYSLFLTRQAVKASSDAATDTQESLRIAQINADQAARQVAISEETARHQLRAYLDVAAVDASAPLERAGPVEIIIRTRNAGQTPAHDVEHFGSLWIGPPDQAPEIIVPQVHRPKTVVSPGGGKRHVIRGDVSLDHAHKLATGEFRLFAFGEIKYRDVFGNEQVTRYRRVYVIGMLSLIMSLTGNSAT